MSNIGSSYASDNCRSKVQGSKFNVPDPPTLSNSSSDLAVTGYREIQNPPKRYGIIDLRQLSALCGFSEIADFQRAHRDWVDEALRREMVARESRWSEAVAVGSLSFVSTVKSELGFKAAHQAALRQFNSSKVQKFNVTRLFGPQIELHIRPPGQSEAYTSNFTGQNEVLSSENARFWNENPEATAT
jgi:hypothetical protein